MNRDSDLVVDSKLTTQFESCFTVHTLRDNDTDRRRRTSHRKEYWQRERRIGGGAYGSVWLEKCVQGHKGIDVRAVKQISTRPMKNGGSIDYGRELEAFAKFSHRNYVDCFVESFGWYEGDDFLFIVMEYLPSGDLERYLYNSSPLAEDAAGEITSQILEGLAFMHENRFAHRDLKPGNILIKSCPPQPWWVKIGDFGISKRLEDETAQSTLLKGTLGFIAPELHGFIPLYNLYATDMWALGEISFQLMTKKPVFENIASFASYALQAKPFPSADLRTHNGSQDVCAFIMSLMDPTPQNRLNADQAQAHGWMRRFLPEVIEPVSSPPPPNTTASDYSGSSWASPSSSVNTTIDALATWRTDTSLSPASTQRIVADSTLKAVRQPPSPAQISESVRAKSSQRSHADKTSRQALERDVAELDEELSGPTRIIQAVEQRIAKERSQQAKKSTSFPLLPKAPEKSGFTPKRPGPQSTADQSMGSSAMEPAVVHPPSVHGTQFVEDPQSQRVTNTKTTVDSPMLSNGGVYIPYRFVNIKLDYAGITAASKVRQGLSRYQQDDINKALQTACQCAYKESHIRKLIFGGADVNYESEYNVGGDCALAYEIMLSRRVEVMRLLLEHGANPNSEMNDFGPLLSYAAFSGHIEVMTLLLEAGADPDRRSPGRKYETAWEAVEDSWEISSRDTAFTLLRQYGAKEVKPLWR